MFAAVPFFALHRSSRLGASNIDSETAMSFKTTQRQGHQYEIRFQSLFREEWGYAFATPSVRAA